MQKTKRTLMIYNYVKHTFLQFITFFQTLTEETKFYSIIKKIQVFGN